MKKLFWSEVAVLDLFAITLCATMYFDVYGVFWWFCTTKYAIWYIASVGGMMGLSFDSVTQNLKQFKKPLGGTRAFIRLRITRSLAEALSPVKGLRKW